MSWVCWGCGVISDAPAFVGQDDEEHGDDSGELEACCPECQAIDGEDLSS